MADFMDGRRHSKANDYRERMASDTRLLAGEFSQWLVDMQSAIAGEADADVVCGDCAGCCQSSQFIHIGPDETDALAHIPPELLFVAPMMPNGHVLMGYDERGWCPMLTDDGCTIYDHRPVTCRTFDCRVFPAAGIDADADKPLVQAAASRWDFTYATEQAEVAHLAIKSVAAAVDEGRSFLPDDVVPHNRTQLAVLAIEIHAAFFDAPVKDVDLIELIRERGRS